MSQINYCDIEDNCKLLNSIREELKTEKTMNLLNENLLTKVIATLQEIKNMAEQIINEEDKPACVYDDDCPMNGGAGFDNHCNEHCPLILSKQIQLKCIEVLEKGE